MDLRVINELISDLEQADSSLSNIRNLSALYTVRKQLTQNTPKDDTRKELDDILPSYVTYIESKRKSAMTQTSDEYTCINMQRLCKEIQEFIQSLYTATTTNEERDVIRKLITNLTEAF